MEKIKIIIAEDHQLMRSAICSNLTNGSSEIEIIGQCCDGIELLEILKFKIHKYQHIKIWVVKKILLKISKK